MAELVKAGQGPLPRPVRGGAGDHPAGARGAPDRGAADGVFALDPRPGGRAPGADRGARHRLRRLQPARPRLPDRRAQEPDDLAPDDWRRTNPRFQGENFEKNLELVEELEALARAKGTTPAQLALAWLLTRGKDVVPIPGSRRIERLEENAAAADIKLTDNELHRLELIAPVGAAVGTRYPEPMMAALNG